MSKEECSHEFSNAQRTGAGRAVPLGGGAEYGRCAGDAVVLRPAVPPGGARQHGHGVRHPVGDRGRTQRVP